MLLKHSAHPLLHHTINPYYSTIVLQQLSTRILSKYTDHVEATPIDIHHYQITQNLINSQYCPATIIYKEIEIQIEQVEYCSRVYQLKEFSGKIQKLSEYYKFNRDLPRNVDKQLVRILQRYHQKIRSYDFKVIKAAIKREQGISLTTQKNQSSFQNSEDSEMQNLLKSRYSNVLDDFHHQQKIAQSNNDPYQNQSRILNSMCYKIDSAFKDVSEDDEFTVHGNFSSGKKQFQEYLKEYHKKRQKYLGNNQNKLKNEVRKNNLFKKKNIHEKDSMDYMKIHSKPQTNIQMLQNFNVKNSYKNIKDHIKLANKNKNTFLIHQNNKKKSLEKTTANEHTISVEQRGKRILEKYENKQPLLNYEFENQRIAESSNQNAIFRPLSTALITMKTNAPMLKTINQIYKTSEKFNSLATHRSRKISSTTNNNGEAPRASKPFSNSLNKYHKSQSRASHNNSSKLNLHRKRKQCKSMALMEQKKNHNKSSGDQKIQNILETDRNHKNKSKSKHLRRSSTLKKNIVTLEKQQIKNYQKNVQLNDKKSQKNIKITKDLTQFNHSNQNKGEKKMTPERRVEKISSKKNLQKNNQIILELQNDKNMKKCESRSKLSKNSSKASVKQNNSKQKISHLNVRRLKNNEENLSHTLNRIDLKNKCLLECLQNPMRLSLNNTKEHFFDCKSKQENITKKTDLNELLEKKLSVFKQKNIRI